MQWRSRCYVFLWIKQSHKNPGKIGAWIVYHLVSVIYSVVLIIMKLQQWFNVYFVHEASWPGLMLGQWSKWCSSIKNHWVASPNRPPPPAPLLGQACDTDTDVNERSPTVCDAGQTSLAEGFMFAGGMQSLFLTCYVRWNKTEFRRGVS